MSIIRGMLIITYELGNASLLCWALLERFAVAFGALITATGFPIYASLPPALAGKPDSML